MRKSYLPVRGNWGAGQNGNIGDLTSRVAPAPNQTGSSTVTTNYVYDALHRLTYKAYSDGTTPAMYYGYDTSPSWISGLTNLVGRLVVAYNQFAGTNGKGTTTVYSYDAVGRINEQWQQTPVFAPGGEYLNYTYDFAGNPLSSTNGVGVTFNQTFDTAARPTQLTSSLVDSQHPATLATTDSSVGYYPHGAVRKMAFGNGLTQATEVESRLQPCEINVNSSGSLLTGCGVTPSGNVQDHHYVFGSWGSTNSGDVTAWIASGAQNFNRSYSYDSLDRLSALSSPSDPNGCTGLSWTYDAWGNRTDQTVTGGTCPTFHQTVNTQNRFANSPYAYDSPGNLTADGSHTYFYDAENRLIQVDGTLGTCSTASACYVYDALGRRAEKITGSTDLDYLYDLSGNVVTEWCTNCGGYTGWAKGYVYFNGGLSAEYANATTYFVHSDHLNSSRVLTGTNQAVAQNLDYLPFGELNSSNSLDNTHMFTGDERDAETDLDHTWFRQYSNAQARWLTPDPAGLAAVDPTDPQSWNRYAYVENDPVDWLDPFGLCGGGPGNVSFMIGTVSAGISYVGTTYTSPACLGGGGDDINAEAQIFAHGGGRSGGWGFTLGIKTPSQTYKQCLAANSHTYSAGGALELAGNVLTGTNTDYSSNRAVDFVTGNSINSVLFGSATDAGSAGGGQAPGLIGAGMGAVTTYGRRTGTELAALNLAGNGGIPKALSEAGGRLATKSFFSAVGDALNLGLSAAARLGIDIGLTSAELFGCAIPRR